MPAAGSARPVSRIASVWPGVDFPPIGLAGAALIVALKRSSTNAVVSVNVGCCKPHVAGDQHAPPPINSRMTRSVRPLRT
eukprot:scaffold49777_cov85-Phaeocystis_antarctica.AAC.1